MKESRLSFSALSLALGVVGSLPPLLFEPRENDRDPARGLRPAPGEVGPAWSMLVVVLGCDGLSARFAEIAGAAIVGYGPQVG